MKPIRIRLEASQLHRSAQIVTPEANSTAHSASRITSPQPIRRCAIACIPGAASPFRKIPLSELPITTAGKTKSLREIAFNRRRDWRGFEDTQWGITHSTSGITRDPRCRLSMKQRWSLMVLCRPEDQDFQLTTCKSIWVQLACLSLPPDKFPPNVNR